MLVEILANTWNTYRMGLTNSVQHNDFDSAILFSQCMNRSIPQISRPEIPVFPIAKGLTDDIALKQNKWFWLLENQPKIEEHISKWIFVNLQKAQEL